VTGGPAAFFRAAFAAFETAVASAGSFPTDLAIAGSRVTLRFAGEALVPRVLPALEPLVVPHAAGEPGLTVCLFDSETTGIAIPDAPWPRSAYGPQGCIEGYNDERFTTVYEQGTGLLRLFDRERALSLQWGPRPDSVPYWESTFPFRSLLHWWLRDRPLQMVHAAAVGTPEGGILLAGRSGSGKSTTSLACLLDGLDYVGDDYVLAEIEPAPYVHGLYATAKVEPANLSRLPALAPYVENAGRLAHEKAVIRLGRPGAPHAWRLSPGFPVRAVAVPQVTGRRDTRVVPASPVTALTALAPTTLAHLPRGHEQALAKMGRLVRSVPCFVLELGTAMGQVSAAVRSLLDQGTSRSR